MEDLRALCGTAGCISASISKMFVLQRMYYNLIECPHSSITITSSNASNSVSSNTYSSIQWFVIDKLEMDLENGHPIITTAWSKFECQICDHLFL